MVPFLFFYLYIICIKNKIIIFLFLYYFFQFLFISYFLIASTNLSRQMLHLKISNPHLIQTRRRIFLLRRRISSNFISFHFHRRFYLEAQNINEASHLYQNAQRSSGSGTLANKTESQPPN